MEWMLSHLLNNPEALKKAHAEIESYVGDNRLVNESDLPNLPYLLCIINETMRINPPGPLVFHESAKDCIVGGYHIPSGTMLLMNLWAMQNDPKNWEDPKKFKPERFVGLEGSRDGYKLMPFGAGRRRCPAENMAMRMVGLALGTLIQCFEWETTSDEMIDMTEGKGLTMPKAKPQVAKSKAFGLVQPLASGSNTTTPPSTLTDEWLIVDSVIQSWILFTFFESLLERVLKIRDRARLRNGSSRQYLQVVFFQGVSKLLSALTNSIIPIMVLSSLAEIRQRLLFMASSGIDRDAKDALSKILQIGTVTEYQNEFEILINRVTGISEYLLKSFYISGLKLALQIDLLRARPTTLGEAFSLACIIEAYFEDENNQTIDNNVGDQKDPNMNDKQEVKKADDQKIENVKDEEGKNVEDQ
ncbi:cytochrome P450 [Tanacetum coccineum]